MDRIQPCGGSCISSTYTLKKNRPCGWSAPPGSRILSQQPQGWPHNQTGCNVDKKIVVPSATEMATRFTQDSFVFDCLSMYYVIDDPWAENCLAAGVNATNVTFGTEQPWDIVLRDFDSGLEKIERSPYLALATNRQEIDAANKQGKLAVIIGTQGSAMVDLEFHRLRTMHRLGMRYFGLAYTGPTLFADGCGESRNAGLSFAGIELIDACNDLGLILDLSHVGHRSREEAVTRSRFPVCTHSNSYALNPNDRNTTDETARAIRAKGGIMGICGLPRTVHPENATLNELLDHADHWVKTVDAAHVGFGLDFVEAYKSDRSTMPAASRLWRTRRPDIFGTVEEFHLQDYPLGIASIKQLPNLTQGLFDRGYAEKEVAGIIGGNWLRHFTEVYG